MVSRNSGKNPVLGHVNTICTRNWRRTSRSSWLFALHNIPEISLLAEKLSAFQGSLRSMQSAN